MNRRSRGWLLGVLILGGCAVVTTAKFEQRYGTPAPRDRIVEALPAGDVQHLLSVVRARERGYTVRRWESGNAEGIRGGMDGELIAATALTPKRIRPSPYYRGFCGSIATLFALNWTTRWAIQFAATSPASTSVVLDLLRKYTKGRDSQPYVRAGKI